MSDRFDNCAKYCGNVVPVGMTFCSNCQQMENIFGHRRTTEEVDRDSDPEGSERPGADATGTAVALTGEDAGARGGAYPGIADRCVDFPTDALGLRFRDGIVIMVAKQDVLELGVVLDNAGLWRLARAEIDRRVLAPGASMSLTAAEMRKLMEDAGMLRPQMPFYSMGPYTPATGVKSVSVQVVGGGGGGRGVPGLVLAGIFGQALAPLSYAQPSPALQWQLQAMQNAYNQAMAMPPPPNPMAPPKPIEDGGIVVGEIVGWRCWNLTAGCLLRSIAVDSTWTPGQPMSAGDGPHGEDWEAHFATSGGVHAWKKREDAFRYGASGVGPLGAIIGTVRLSGQVIEHERGYRAEVAEIASLDWLVSDMPLPEYNSSLQRARALYGVDGEGGYMKPLGDDERWAPASPGATFFESPGEPFPIRRIAFNVAFILVAGTVFGALLKLTAGM